MSYHRQSFSPSPLPHASTSTLAAKRSAAPDHGPWTTSPDTRRSYIFIRPTTPELPVVVLPGSPRRQHTKSASHDQSFARATSIDAPLAGSSTTPMVRKKAGELVRSSLRAAICGVDGKRRSRSEPASPTCPKFVHFDAQLEHVKLFLSQQRPAAVSCSGSLVETEMEDQGSLFKGVASGAISMRLPDLLPNDHARDVYLEKLDVVEDGKGLRGVVRVRNLAFEKWVAVRFTLDMWQTVSEVSAEHLESMGPRSDRFVFTIKLHDSHAPPAFDERTMFVALRYMVGGREIWDNNGGANYRVELEKRVSSAGPFGGVRTRRLSQPSAFRRFDTWSGTSGDESVERKADMFSVLDESSPSPRHSPLTPLTSPVFSPLSFPTLSPNSASIQRSRSPLLPYEEIRTYSPSVEMIGSTTSDAPYSPRPATKSVAGLALPSLPSTAKSGGLSDIRSILDRYMLYTAHSSSLLPSASNHAPTAPWRAPPIPSV